MYLINRNGRSSLQWQTVEAQTALQFIWTAEIKNMSC